MKILYVDDEQDLLQLAKTFFEEEGLQLDTAESFAHGLEMLSKNKFEIIIADMRMPQGSGVELVKQAREKFAFSGKFILVSGDLMSKDELHKLGCDLMLSKPVDFLSLIDTVKALLQSK